MPPTNPRPHVLHRLIIGGLIITACAAFAFWPLTSAAIKAPLIETAPPAPQQLVALDLAAFRTPIWVAEPPAPAPAAPPPPPPPLRLKLLAIIREADIYRAAVYDPDTDKILMVAAGEKLGSQTVEQVDGSTLTLRDDAGMRVLALKEGRSP